MGDKIIEKIEILIKKFIEDWKKSPYVWGNEIDAQVEIASRIKNGLRELGEESLKAQYSGYKKEEKSIRLCCEPPIYYEKGGKRSKCFPDIVVFDNIPDAKRPPDERDQYNWPMIWICEIKYETEWG